jgi:RND family efflux transporter MFP subunit
VGRTDPNITMSQRNIPLMVLSRAVLSIALIAVAVLIAGWLVGTKPEAAESDAANRLRSVVVVDVIDAPVGRRLRAYGSARALLSADVPARVSATVTGLGERYGEGERVAKDEVLLRLDDTDFRHQLEITRQTIDAVDAQLAILVVDERTIAESLVLAEADARLVRADVERAEAALREGAAKEREVDRLRQALIAADRALVMAREARDKVEPRRLALRAERARLEASREVAQDAVDRSVIRSPMDGVLQHADKEIGEMVAMGAPIARVVDPTRLEVPLLLPASARPLVAVGQPVLLMPDRAGASVIDARVTRVAPEDDAVTRTFAVFAEIEASEAIAPGTFVEASILCDAGAPRTVLPRRSVSEGRVYVVREGRVHITPVEVEFALTGLKPETGLPDSEWLVLREPLPTGSKVVLDASRQIPDGTAIAAQPPGGVPAKASAGTSEVGR